MVTSAGFILHMEDIPLIKTVISAPALQFAIFVTCFSILDSVSFINIDSYHLFKKISHMPPIIVSIPYIPYLPHKIF